MLDSWLRQRALVLLWGALVTQIGCTGIVQTTEGDPPRGSPAGGTGGGTTGGGGGTAGTGGPIVPNPAACNAVDPGPSFARRLTRFEYDNTVRDLLGDTSAPARAFPPEERRHGFDNNADALTVSPLLGEQYFMAAERLATGAVDRGLNALVGCDPAQTGEDTCADRFLASFGTRAYRRPPTADELTVLRDVYRAGKASGGFKTGIRLALTTMLQSPRFLYRLEDGGTAEAGAIKLDGWSVASRLAYLLWGTMPDGELLQAAADGKLSTREQIATHARRMLTDAKHKEKVRGMLAHFHEQWLELHLLETTEKDSKVFPTFDRTLLASMGEESRRFLDAWAFDPDADFSTIFTAPHTFVDAKLAAHYKLTFPMVAGKPATGFQKVALDGQKRAGVLTHGSVLAMFSSANQTSPVLRGKFVREQFLCQSLPPPPNDLVIELPALDPNLTTRERFNRHAADTACSGCHKLMDPIGLGFENFDAVGIWRDNENGKAVDASGEVVGISDGAFVGATALGKRLASSDEARACFALKWFHFAYGRELGSGNGDACNLNLVNRRFAESGYKLRELLLALTETNAFLYRRTDAGGAR
jgi:hypothetical protein